MNIFVINSGSSSIKYQLFRMPDERPLCSGLVERIGMEDSIITHRTFVNGSTEEIKHHLPLRHHEHGLQEVAKLLTDKLVGVIKDPGEIHAVGHRVVHGGENFQATTIITSEIKSTIKELFTLAPLHNPANYLGIEVAESIFVNARQVAVFDTAFHQSMPETAYRYAIPQSFYTDLRIRAYGFHGTSHKFVSEQAMLYLKNPDAKLITIHLGNGCSMAAIKAGRSLDTSMGFGPNSGLIMGSRSGDIDPSVIFHLIEEMNFTAEEVNELLNKKSGMIGLTGYSDMRDITKAIAGGDRKATLAIEMYAYRIKKYIGAYVAVLNGLDAIVFTAGVGENSANIRERICAELQYFGIYLDHQKNNHRADNLKEINTESSGTKILVIPTNEELEIVKQCYELLA